MIQLQFEFEGKALLFRGAHQILKAYTVKEVEKILDKAEKARRNGYYVAGYVRYEAAAAFQNFAVKETGNEPLIWFGVFKKPTSPFEYKPAMYPLSFKMDTDLSTYKQDLTRIKSEIAHGNTYQVNHTVRLHAKTPAVFDTHGLFVSLKENAAVSYSAHLITDEHDILSVSPELFFKKEKSQLTTRPMKGTAPRKGKESDDNAQYEWLKTDEKNRAENVMIVDLLRNDLGKVALPGTVHVEKLCAIEKYPTVWQMTSTITAETPPKITLRQLFEALFPCGSITGAPKASTMQIISEIEKSRRGVYCGAIGYMTPGDEMIFSIPIRTLEINKEKQIATYGVGGGIVWDSKIEKEFEEIQAKSRVLENTFADFHLLECLRLENGVLARLDAHLNRLEQSASMFNFRFNRAQIKSQWLQKAKEAGRGTFKFRSELAKDGGLWVEYTPIPQKNRPLSASLAHMPCEFYPLTHVKTTRREYYEKMRSPNTEETLLFNEAGELLEFLTGNVVLQLGNKLVTPSAEAALPGVFQSECIKNGTIVVRRLTITDLNQADKIWLINSVREFVEIRWKDNKQ